MRHSALNFAGVDTDGHGSPYRMLLVAMDFYPGRWSGPVVAAACAIPGASHLTAQDWVDVLDELESALAPIMLPECHSAVRIRRAPIAN